MRRVGVIDIGSNSVRLVVFGVVGGALVSLFDEKTMCGLGTELRRTGRLHPEGTAKALAELRRFAHVAGNLAPDDLFSFATAAVRDADDGAAFVAAAAATGLRVEVISGLEEARYAALGVSGSIPGANGVVGDLGGGSLELVWLDGGAVREQATLPVGTLRAAADAPHAETRAWLNGALAGVPWLERARGRDLFLVGGAWRSFARLHMARHDYPLSIVHQYAIPTDSGLKTAEVVSRMGARSVERLEAVSRRRRLFMPYAAHVLARIADRLGPRAIVASGHGLREGFVRDRLALDGADPLLAHCRAFGAQTARIPADGAALCRWLTPLFEDEDEIASNPRWLQAACWLADVAGREHPDRRGEIAYTRTLHWPSVALCHGGRVFLAVAVATRYGLPIKNGRLAGLRQLLPPARLAAAKAVGSALSLAHAISPSGAELARVAVRRQGAALALTGPPGLLAGDTVRRRLAALAERLGLKPKMIDTG